MSSYGSFVAKVILRSFFTTLCIACSLTVSAQPYSVNWAYPVNASISGTTVTKTLGGSAWNGGAITTNVLDANTDGWMEFVVQTGALYQVGFSVNNIIDVEQLSNAILINYTNSSYTIYEGASVVSSGTWQVGDVFRISREVTQVKYYKNGNAVRTVNANTGIVKIKATLNAVGKSTPNITTSFDSKLILQGTVNGLDGSSGSGSIAMSVLGGTSPYTYSWSSGEQTSSISNKPLGSYTVTVTDAVGRTQSKTYQLGYKINWINKIGVNTSGEILTKNATLAVWTNSGAMSSNILPANTDGWIEFSAASASNYVIGFAVNNVIDYTEFSNAIQMYNPTSTTYTLEGATMGGIGQWQIGDIFRIAREGSQINYYQNGVVKRTVAVNPGLEFKVKVTIKDHLGNTPSITTSFDSKLMLQGTVNGLDGSSGSGSISMSVLGGTSPYTYSWSSGEQTSSISNKPLGSYTVTVTDAVGRTQSKTYQLGYKINWINKIGVNTAGDILTKNTTLGVWTNSGAISTNILPANTDGWIEFSATSACTYIIGFAVNNIIDYTEFSNAIYMYNPNSSIYTYESATMGGIGPGQIGDVFRISREGSQVNYYQKGVIKRTVAVNPGLELKVKVTIKDHLGNTPSITTSFDNKLILQGTVNGLDGSNGSGSISMNVLGGTGPYTYSWSSGEQTSSISNKPLGSYTVTVTDAVGRTQTKTYQLGYKINWINKTGVNTAGDILTKNVTQGLWTNSGAISSNILPANTDGWIEFSAASVSNYIIGFAVNNIIDILEFNNGIQMYNPNSTTYTYEGTTQGYIGQWQIGDILRIAREGGNVNYYQNGIIKRTVAVNPGLEFKVKVTLKDYLGNTPNITTSFDSKLILQQNINGPAGNDGSGGNISVSVLGGTAPYVYSWSSGEQASSIINKPLGSYVVTVSDAVGRTVTKTYSLGYKVDWINKIGVNTSGDILTKNTTLSTWTNSGAISSNILPANTDGWIEFPTTSASDFIIGLSVNNTIDYNTFTNAFKIHNISSNCFSYEGSLLSGIGQWQMGDVFRISREGNQMKYYQNGVVRRAVTVNPALILKVKVTIQGYAKSTPSITASFWQTDGIARTFYAIANGNWTTPSIWSLSENGPPSTVYPDDIDKVVIKGYEVTVNSPIKSAGIIISAINENTKLKVDGAMGVLTVKGNILMNRENVTNTTEMLLVQNNAKLDVK